MIRLVPFLFAGTVALASPAAAQSVGGGVAPAGDPAAASILDGDYVALGLGPALSPSYEGSDDTILTAAPVVIGSVSGFDFASRAIGIGVDLIREPREAKLNLQAGPVLSLNLDRSSRIEDRVVRRLGKIGPALQGGGYVGVAYSGLLNPFDTAGAQVEVVTDLGDVHKGTIVTPSISYGTPLSTALFALVTVSATHISDNYAQRYFSVTPAGSLASGLPVFNAGGGWKDAGGSLSVAYDLSGDLRDGGLGVFARGSYARLQDDAARSPIVRIRGDRDQLFAAVGLSYTF